MYGSWYMACNRQKFLSLWATICPFTYQNNPEKQNFDTRKKMPGDIIILHMCTINDDHMMSGSRDMKCNRTFCHYRPFLPIYPTNNSKNQNFQKMKTKQLEISSFYTSVPKIMTICYTVPEIWCMTDVIFILHTALFLPFFALKTRKIKFLKIRKKTLEISFYTCVPKIMIKWCTVPEIW